MFVVLLGHLRIGRYEAEGQSRVSASVGEYSLEARLYIRRLPVFTSLPNASPVPAETISDGPPG